MMVEAGIRQRVLITAGAVGIGRAIAEAFVDQGAEVWVVDVDEASLATCPPDWYRNCLDVTDEAAVLALFQELDRTWGGLDVLCANAGIAGPIAPVEEISLADWRRCVSVSLEGAFLFARQAAPMMKVQRSGAVVLTSSTAGIFGFRHRAPYVAAKWGVIGLMKTLASELGPFNVRANAICPGPVEGNRMERVLEKEALIQQRTRDEIYAGYAAGASMRRFVTAQDVAGMAVFLASDAACLVSGQVIAVDGNTENPESSI